MTTGEAEHPGVDPAFRLQRALHQARYLWLEELLAGRRLLEVGLVDASIIVGSGASQTWATTATEKQANNARRIGVSSVVAKPGEIPFSDASFDAVVVPDFARQWQSAAPLLQEIKRVLAPRGFAVLVLEGDGGWWQPDLPSGEDLRHRIRQTFPEARFCLEAPFVGVRLGPAEQSPDLSLDESLASDGGSAQVLALVGHDLPDERTLVQLPFELVSAVTETRVDRLAEALERSQGELTATKHRLVTRERALAEVAERLPRLRAAVQARLSLPQPSAVVEPTVLERPGPTPNEDLRSALAASERRRAEVESELEQFRRSDIESSRVQVADAEWSSVGPTPHPSGTVIQAYWEQQDNPERERLTRDLEQERRAQRELKADLDREREERLRAQTQILKLTDELRESEKTRVDTRSQLPEVRAETELDPRFQQLTIRAQRLETALTHRDEEVARLERELAGQLEVRHILGSEIEDSGARFARMTAELEELRLILAAQEQQSSRDKQSLADLLSRADSDRENLERDLSEAKAQLSEALAQQEHAEQLRQRERGHHFDLAKEVDMLRHRLAERQGDPHLHNVVQEQERMLSEAQENLRSKDSEQRAVELAASHLSREVDLLRRRVKALRNERDTLAAAAASLVAERDEARAEAQAQPKAEVIEAELEVRLAREIEPLQRQLAGAEARAEALERDRAALSESRQLLESEVEELKRAAAEQETEDQTVRDLARSLDQRLAEHQVALGSIEGEREAALARARELEMMLFEAAAATRQAHRGVEHEQAVQDELRAELRSANDELAQALAAKAQAELELADSQAAQTESKARLALEAGEHASTLSQIQKAFEEENEQGQADLLAQKDAELTAKEAELQDLQEGLSKTLEQAAQMSQQIAEFERELLDAKSNLERGERELLEVESQRKQGETELKASEAARRHAVAEVQELSQRLARASFERDELFRELDVRTHRVRELEDEVIEVRASQLPIPVLDEPIDDPWPRRYEEARAEVRTLREALDAAQARPQVTPANRAIHVEDHFEISRRVVDDGRWRDLETELEIARGRQVAAELQREKLQAQLSKAEATSVSAEDQAARQLEIEMLKRQLVDSQREGRQAERALETAGREQESLRRSLFAAQSQQAVRSAAVESTEEALRLAQTELDVLSQELSVAQAQLEAAEHERSQLVAAADSASQLREELKAERSHRDRVESRLAEAEDKASLGLPRSVAREPVITEVASDAGLRLQLAQAKTRALLDRIALHEAEELRGLRDASSGAADEVTQVDSSELAEMAERAGRAELAAAEAKRRAAETERELERLQVAQARSEAHTADSLREVAAAKGQLAEARQRLQRLESERTVSQRKVLELERALEKQRARDAATPTQSDVLAPTASDPRVEQLTAQLRRTERELDEARAEIGRKLNALREADTRQARAARQTEEAHQDIARLQDKLRRDGDAEELQLKVAELGRKIAGLEAERDALNEDVHRLRARLTENEAEQIGRDRELARLEFEVSERDRKLESAARELAEKNELVRRLKDR